ncbi:MAG TPA: flavocytochrome c [Feifaniaceae bacterium]|nr:flavocytochrome c [Feifaniaceae bacterium]
MKRTGILALLLAMLMVFGAACAPAAAPGETPAPAGTPAETQSGAYTPGVYTASAKGNNGDVKVEVEVSETEILSVKVLEHQETPGISDKAISDLPAAIVAAQGLGLDAVSGATFTSSAILEAVAACMEQAGADVEALKAVSGAKTAQAADETLEADVVVIGAGGAGLAAAVQANQDGASVIVIEKQSSIGGNTILSGGAFNAVRDGSEEAIANDDSVQKHYEQTLQGGDNEGDPELVRTLVENAYDGLEWLKSLGMEFKEGVFTVTGGLWPRAHKPVEPVGTGFFKTYQKYVDEHENIDILLNTKADGLIVDGTGRVAGVKATGETGNAITLNAKKAVILATGGFAKNVEMRMKYDTIWGNLSEDVQSTNHPGATGDGIVMAEAVGAQLIQMGYIQLLPLGDPATGSLSGNIELDVERRIFVNKNGDRFVNEGGRRDDMTKALFEQPDHMMWIVLDSHCYPTGEEKNNFNETANQLVAEGRAFKGETVEELAKAINVPAENLKKALDDFNAHVKTKEPDAFGRTLYSDPIDQGPFYAAARVPTVHHTMGGVKINKEAQVINAGGEIIPGLYAAGEVTGGIHGTNRLGGNALADILVFGRIAGKNAAAEESR